MSTATAPTYQNAQNEQIGAKALLGMRNFRLLWLGQIISDFGDALTSLALLLLINRVTGGSTTAIAYLLIAMALPQVTIGLLAGVFVDRWDRKRTMIVSDLLRGMLVLAFAIVSFFDHPPLWLFYAIAFAASAVSTFFTPARGALIPQIVPQAGLMAANSLAQMSSVLFRVIGTAAAGALVGLTHTYWLPFVLDSLTFFASALMLLALRLPAETSRQRMEVTAGFGAEMRAVFSELGQGLGMIARSRMLMGMMLTAAISMLGLGAVNVLVAPLLVNELKVSETWFGVIEFFQAGGMILSAALVTVIAARLKPSQMIVTGLIGVGICIGLVSSVYSIWHFLPILFAVGVLVTPVQTALSVIGQQEVENAARGRIFSALGAVVTTASLVSMFAAGTVAAQIGARNVFILGGVITCVAGLVSAWIFAGAKPKSAPIPQDVPQDVARDKMAGVGA